jgi:hypothetical protein
VLGGDHTIAWPDAAGVAQHLGAGRISMIHFDAHADTGDVEFGSLVGHGQPMRRLIESGALRGDRFLQIGPAGLLAGPETLEWMAEQGMRSYEMTEIGVRGLDACLTEAFAIAMDDCDGVFLSVDVDVCDPAHAPGTGTPEPGGLTARQLLDAVRRIAVELPVVGMDVVEVSPPYDHAELTSFLANRVVWRRCRGWRAGAAATRGTRRSRCSTAADPRSRLQESHVHATSLRQRGFPATGGQRVAPAATAAWTARARRAPHVERGPPYASPPPGGHSTTTASLAVPVPGTPAPARAWVFASVAVTTALTRAASDSGAGTCATTLIVPGRGENAPSAPRPRSARTGRRWRRSSPRRPARRERADGSRGQQAGAGAAQAQRRGGAGQVRARIEVVLLVDLDVHHPRPLPQPAAEHAGRHAAQRFRQAPDQSRAGGAGAVVGVQGRPRGAASRGEP